MGLFDKVDADVKMLGITGKIQSSARLQWSEPDGALMVWMCWQTPLSQCKGVMNERK